MNPLPPNKKATSPSKATWPNFLKTYAYSPPQADALVVSFNPQIFEDKTIYKEKADIRFIFAPFTRPLVLRLPQIISNTRTTILVCE
jgi:hypothetical protein